SHESGSHRQVQKEQHLRGRKEKGEKGEIDERGHSGPHFSSQKISAFRLHQYEVFLERCRKLCDWESQLCPKRPLILKATNNRGNLPSKGRGPPDPHPIPHKRASYQCQIYLYSGRLAMHKWYRKIRG
ncbi:hypothetical protein NQ317_007370, partial [Molorchus minor]